MEYNEAERVLQRLRGEYRSETVPDPNTFRRLPAVMDGNSKGKVPDPNTFRRLPAVMDGNSKGKVPDPNTFRRLPAVLDGNSKGKGTQNQGSTKSQLYEICAVNHWKAPLFECCNEEGPDHQKLFTFKVIVEIRGPRTTIIECMGYPHSKKKAAAESAAEGALWFLNQAGYRLNH